MTPQDLAERRAQELHEIALENERLAGEMKLARERAYLTPREFALLTNQHINTVRRWIQDGFIEATPIGIRQGKTGIPSNAALRIKASEIEEFFTRKKMYAEGMSIAEIKSLETKQRQHPLRVKNETAQAG